MTEERDVLVEGNSYCVVISDEQEALLAAKAAGRAFVGVWKGCSGTEAAGTEAVGTEAVGAHTVGSDAADSREWLWKADYLIGSPEQADERLLERVVRRKLGLPWVIAESDRICVREFTPEDAVQLAQLPENELVGTAETLFSEPDRFHAYIENQYGLYEYGMWAVVRRADRRLVGIAGVSDCDTGSRGREDAEQQLELGYHIFDPYRRQGFAEEACRLILNYAEQEYACPVYAVVEAGNIASARLLDKLGFCLCGSQKASLPDRAGDRREPVTAQKYSGSAPRRYRYVRYWQ